MDLDGKGVVPRIRPRAKDRGLLPEPLQPAARGRCPTAQHLWSCEGGAGVPAAGPPRPGSSWGTADPAVSIRKFLQDCSGPSYGKDRGCSVSILQGVYVCLTIFDVFFSIVPLKSMSTKGLFLCLKPSGLLKTYCMLSDIRCFCNR